MCHRRLCTVAISVTRGTSDRVQVFATFGLRYVITACGGDDTHTEAVFEQMLLALKIYNARNVYYRFSALIASARTQPEKDPCTCVFIINNKRITEIHSWSTRFFHARFFHENHL